MIFLLCLQTKEGGYKISNRQQNTHTRTPTLSRDGEVSSMGCVFTYLLSLCWLDRDPRWIGGQMMRDFPSALLRTLLCLGVEPVICPPKRPDKNPFVERYNRSYKYECILVHRPEPTGYATSEPRGGESPEKRAKTAEKWLPERKLSLCRCWKEWKQGVSYGTVTPRWEKEGCYRIPLREQVPQTYPLLGTML
jgi:hypothetical protein